MIYYYEIIDNTLLQSSQPVYEVIDTPIPPPNSMVIYRYKGHISLNYSRFGHASRRILVLFSGGAFRPSEETLNKSKLARPNVSTMKNIPFLPKNGDRTHINVFPIGCTPQ